MSKIEILISPIILTLKISWLYFGSTSTKICADFLLFFTLLNIDLTNTSIAPQVVAVTQESKL